MSIHLYTLCWNDAEMLPFMFRHYDDFVEKYFVFDDGSTDGSVEILRAHPRVRVYSLPMRAGTGSVFERCLAQLNNCWKESIGRADWVIVTDIDEHLFHSDMHGYLDACKRSGITIIPSLGYQMISDQFPAAEAVLTKTITTGVPDHWYSKLNIFSPNDIREVNFSLGRHTAKPEGRVIAPPRDEVLLLHYKCLGFERLMRRQNELFLAASEDIAKTGLGAHYANSREYMIKVWTDLQSRTVDVSQPDLQPWNTHFEPRWWESYRKAGAYHPSIF